MAAPDQIQYRTGIAAVNNGTHLRVYTQDCQGGIRESMYKGKWSNGTAKNVIVQGKIFSPLAACSKALDEIRIYYLSIDNHLREHCYSANKGWYTGGLNASNFITAPYSKIACYFLAEADLQLRIYSQVPDNTVQEYGYDSKGGWRKMTNLGAALPGSEIATTSYKIADNELHVSPANNTASKCYYQDTSCTLIEKAYDASNGWFLGAFAIASAIPRTSLSCCNFGVTASTVNIRVYYEGTNNRLLEKAHDGKNWYDGAFNQPCIPGTESAVIFWGTNADLNLRCYFQNGTNVSGVSEWMWNGKWSQGVKATPPA